MRIAAQLSAALRGAMVTTLLASAAHAAESRPALERELRAHVTTLADTIGPRGVYRPDALQRAADYIAGQFEKEGWVVRRLGYPVSGVRCENLEVERRGTSRPAEIVVIGAHYDTVPMTPGADDNASGVAALLALARTFARQDKATGRTLRFVAFPNEEPVYFQSELMGSRVYARGCKQRGENIVAMISLESMGYFAENRGSQSYPSFLLRLLYPSRGNFLAFVGNRASKELVSRAARSFKRAKVLPVETAALPEHIAGIGWSDHWSFWQEGYPAIMVTDTAPYRNPHYHRSTDTPATLNFSALAAAVVGLEQVIEDLVRPTP